MTELQGRIRQYLDRISPPISGNASLRDLSDDLDKLSSMIADILEADKRLMAPFNRLHEIMVEKPAQMTRNPDPEILVDGITIVDLIKERLPLEGKNLWQRRISLQPKTE